MENGDKGLRQSPCPGVAHGPVEETEVLILQALLEWSTERGGTKVASWSPRLGKASQDRAIRPEFASMPPLATAPILQGSLEYILSFPSLPHQCSQ